MIARESGGNAMKKIYLLLCIFSLAMAPAFAAGVEPLINVTAEAEVRIKPDRAALTFGLYEKTDNLRQGAQKLNTLSRQVTDYLRNRGIEDRFIQTDSLHIQPIYMYQTITAKNGTKTQQETVRYELSQTFTITLEDPAEYEDVLYALLEMGINRVENVSFYSTQLRQARDEARKLAVQYAREKAALLAEAADIRLGKIVNISENTAAQWPTPRLAASNISQNAVQDLPADGQLPGPATGMISVKASVLLTYKIK